MNSQENTDLNKVLVKLDELDQRMAKMEKYLEKQKGFFGGILLVVSCVGWVVSNIKDWLK